MKHRVYISPFQVGHWNAFDRVTSMMNDIFLGRKSRLEPLFYSSLFQAGITEFLLDESMQKRIPQSEFIQSKVSLLSEDKGQKDVSVVRSFFSEHLPEDYQRDPKYSDVWLLESFLSDLCVGLKNNVDIISTSNLPEIESYQDLLTPEVLLPIDILLSSIKEESTVGPFPRLTVDKADVEAFTNIVKSDLFDQFSSAQGELSEQMLPVAGTLSKIKRLGTEIQKMDPSRLKLTRLSLSLLPVIPKITDAVCGKLPGSVADYFSKIVEPMLKEHKRLVIYDASHIRDSLFVQTLVTISKNKDPEDVCMQRFKEYENKKLFDD